MLVQRTAARWVDGGDRAPLLHINAADRLHPPISIRPGSLKCNKFFCRTPVTSVGDHREANSHDRGERADALAWVARRRPSRMG